ncbi:YesL family protein [Lapidilactobacillus salsurivasis]
MIATTLQRFFNGVYTVLKLSLFFWVLTLAGGVVLGLGPALQTVSDLYVAHHFEYQLITFAEAWRGFKLNFKPSNAWFWVVVLIAGALGYNLYLGVQIKGWFWLFIDFIIIFVLLFDLSVGLSAMTLQSHYEIQWRNLLKLALLQFFHKFAQDLLLVAGLAGLLFLTWKFKAMILFFTVPLIALWSDLVNQPWIKTIEATMADKSAGNDHADLGKRIDQDK